MEIMHAYIKKISQIFQKEKIVWSAMVSLTLVGMSVILLISWFQYLWVSNDNAILPQSKTIRTGMTLQELEDIEKTFTGREVEFQKNIPTTTESHINMKEKDVKK